MQAPYGKVLRLKISRFQPEPVTRTYEDIIKKKLNPKIFSIYKVYNAVYDTPVSVDLVSYVDWGYWNDPYTITYDAFNPYPPIPPIEP